MARPLRIELAGELYHGMSRGNERRNIVRDDADRQPRLGWLERTVETHGWRLHAFALLTNHEHSFVETPEPNLSAGMHLLNSSYYRSRLERALLSRPGGNQRELTAASPDPVGKKGGRGLFTETGPRENRHGFQWADVFPSEKHHAQTDVWMPPDRLITP